METENYRYFSKLYDKYINPVANTLAWVLMPNHFHFLVRIKEEGEVQNPQNLSGHDLTGLKPPHQHFSNLFNAYTRAYNKRYERHGALFERPFKRKLIEGEDFLKNVLLYIHNNPVHHGFCNRPEEYLWSSYTTYLTTKPAKLPRKEIIEIFDDITNFEYVHNEKAELEIIKNIIDKEMFE